MVEQFLTVREAAVMAGVNESTIHYYIKRGYLGDTNQQNVTAGRGCGYKIRLSDLNRYIKGWEVEEKKPAPVPVVDKVDFVDPKELMIDKRSLATAAKNLRIAIEFAQEELSKIEALL